MGSDRSVTSTRLLDDVRHILRQARSQAYAAANAAMVEASWQIGRRIVEAFGKASLSLTSIISGNSTSHFPMRRKATRCVANGQATAHDDGVEFAEFTLGPIEAFQKDAQQLTHTLIAKHGNG